MRKEDKNQGGLTVALSDDLGMPLVGVHIQVVETKENRVRVRYRIDGVTRPGGYYFGHVSYGGENG